MFCTNNLCNKKTFSKIYHFVAINGKITKRFICRTVMVDLESDKIINMIASRKDVGK